MNFKNIIPSHQRGVCQSKQRIQQGNTLLNSQLLKPFRFMSYAPIICYEEKVLNSNSLITRRQVYCLWTLTELWSNDKLWK